MNSLHAILSAGGPFQGYAYAYPHKTAYRPFTPPRALAEVWAPEDKTGLFLYAHVPFCTGRCGFCNLFTLTQPDDSRIASFLDALERQADAVAAALGPTARFARLAIGGGTPTLLSVGNLQRLLQLLTRSFHGARGIPKAIEASPATVDEDRVGLLRREGVTRVSLGVQSFIEAEVRALGRAQQTAQARRALGLLKGAGFACVNVDLMYGMAGQTGDSWRRTLAETHAFEPQEIYLYPLYVRPLTSLGEAGQRREDSRLALYRAGRDFLLERGYRQISMRLFRNRSWAGTEGPVYCCQEDGMVGLGAGARSYTSALHYSTEYAVGREGVLKVIERFTGRTREQFAQADYGCALDAAERRRRYVIKSLLRAEGLDLAAYERSFHSRVMYDLPALAGLGAEGWAVEAEGRLMLTAAGLELSDLIGPWLWSAAVRERMSQFALV